MSDIQLLGLYLAETSRVWRHKLDQRLKPLGLSQAKWLLLTRLHLANEVLTQTQLSELLSIEGPTLVRLLDRMEADGWVERQNSPIDRRAKTVHATEKARDVTREIKRIAAKLREELLAGIPQEDLNVMISVLDRIKQRAEQL